MEQERQRYTLAEAIKAEEIKSAQMHELINDAFDGVAKIVKSTTKVILNNGIEEKGYHRYRRMQRLIESQPKDE
jgi:predicted alpha/beta superfamily hydrolase